MKFAIAILAVFALLLAGCAGSGTQAPVNGVNSSAQVPPAPGNTVAPSASGITLSQLASHNSEADCWVGYDGEVYDITAFIPNHKNYRELIVPLCGSSDQFKAKFEGKHGLSKVDILKGQKLMGSLAAQ